MNEQNDKYEDAEIVNESNALIHARPERMKQELPIISDRLAEILTTLPEELRHLPKIYDVDKFAEYTIKVADNLNETSEHSGIAIGASCFFIKRISGIEKLKKILDQAGLSLRICEILMRNYLTFGDKPELVEGMEYTKVYQLTRLPQEYIDQLKDTGTVILPSGEVITMTALRFLVQRKLTNEVTRVKNEKNKEIREWKERAITAEQENKTIQKNYEENLTMMKKDNPEGAATIESLRNQLVESEKEKADLQIEFDKRIGERTTGEAVIEAVHEAKAALDKLIDTFNRLEPGENKQARAETFAFSEYVVRFNTLLNMNRSDFD